MFVSVKTPIRRVAALLLFLSLSCGLIIDHLSGWTTSSAFAQAQSQQAKISGKVADATTGEALIGVTVAVEGTRKGARTNTYGTFTLAIEPGSYTLRVSAVGYKSKTLESVTVDEGDIKQLTIALEAASVVGQDVVVKVDIDNASSTSQLLERKRASTFNDGLAADQIRRTPDVTSSDAIKRISGVSITDNKFVVVRGVSERYNHALLNGVALTSTEPDKKAFSFDLLPASLLENTVVAKTFTPDLPANFTGGLVQINTVSIPNAPTARISAGASYNAASTGADYLSYQSGGSDWLGYDDGTRALPSGVPSYSLNDTSIHSQRRQQIGRLFKNTWGAHLKTVPISQNVSVSIGNGHQLEEEAEIGYIAAFSYRNGFDRVEIERNQYGGDGLPFFERLGERSTRAVTWGGLANLTYRLDADHSISIKNIYNRTADDDVVRLSGMNYGSQFYEQLTSYRYTERSVYSGQLTGDHKLTGVNNLQLAWRLAHGVSHRAEPDLRRYTYYRDTEDTTRFFSAISSTGSPTVAGRFFSNLQELSDEGAIDLTLPVSLANVKVGGMLSSKTRNFGARAFAYRHAAGGANFALNFSAIDTLLAEHHIGPNGFEIVEVTNPEDRYDAAERINAGYAMLDVPFTIASAELRFVGGARLEHSIQRLNSSILGGSAVRYDRAHTDLLPAASLTYSINEATNLRLSATQTVARPEFREIAPFNFYDFEVGTVVVGDTNIDRALIRNLDARLEYYPTAGEVLSLSVFHKRFEGAIEEINIPTNTNPFRSWRNASVPAINYGIELDLRKNLGFIHPYLYNVTLSANYARIVSKIDMHALTGGVKSGTRPMQGQSPFSVNVGVFFTEPELGTSLSVLYNTSGTRLAAVNLDTEDLYEQPRDVLDLSIGQPLFERYELKYNAKDVLAQPQEFWSGDKLERKNRRAMSHSLSLAMRF